MDLGLDVVDEQPSGPQRWMRHWFMSWAGFATLSARPRGLLFATARGRSGLLARAAGGALIGRIESSNAGVSLGTYATSSMESAKVRDRQPRCNDAKNPTGERRRVRELSLYGTSRNPVNLGSRGGLGASSSAKTLGGCPLGDDPCRPDGIRSVLGRSSVLVSSVVGLPNEVGSRFNESTR